MATVFCSGCFDMLHSGHVAFFEEAAKLGEVHVGIGSDQTVFQLKGRRPVNTQDERLYMVRALRPVSHAWINSGSGILDYVKELQALAPDYFYVNEDGDTVEKQQLCSTLGIAYVVGKRVPHGELPIRSTTSYRQDCLIPYRLDLAGGWLDQPLISSLCPGPVLTISLEPDVELMDRAGMATSSRKKAIELWQTLLPSGDPIVNARTLFCYENPPGKKEVSGSQDSLGIVLPGLNRLDYSGDFWPEKITPHHAEETLSWIEKHLRIVFLCQREPDFDVYAESDPSRLKAKALSDAAMDCWQALLTQDFSGFAKAFTASFEAQLALFPHMMTERVHEAIERYRPYCSGWKLAGAGGGGYLCLWSDQPVAGGFAVRIRRE